MHDTLCANVKGYIDENVAHQGYGSFRGWCFHEQHNICPLRAKLSDEIIINNVKIELRKDVGGFYKNDMFDLAGWSFNVSNPGVYDLQMYFDKEWHTVFKLTYEEKK